MKKSLLALLVLLSVFAFTAPAAEAHPYYHHFYHGYYHHHYFYGGRWYDYNDGCAFGPGVVIQVVP